MDILADELATAVLEDYTSTVLEDLDYQYDAAANRIITGDDDETTHWQAATSIS